MQNTGKKLQLKPGSSILLLNAPVGFAETLAAEGYTVSAITTNQEAVQLFVKNREELEHWAPQAVAALKPGGLLWIAYPKKTSGIPSNLTRDEGWKILAERGLEAVRQIAIDGTWSSLRFRLKQERKTTSTFGIDPPGIDRVAKTVEVPLDLQEALSEAGLQEKFEKLAFTHRKEYVLAVLEAKRPETRANRIRKIIEALGIMVK